MSFVDEIKDKFKLMELSGYRLLLVNGKGVCFEGHRGIYEISDTVIKLRVKKGAVTITGADLNIVEITDSEVYISGIIKGIEL